MYSEWRDSFYLLELPPCFKPKKLPHRHAMPKIAGYIRHSESMLRMERDQGHGVKIEKNEPADFLFRLKSASLNLIFEEEIAVKLAILRCRIAKKLHQTCLWTSFLGPQLTIHSWTNHIMQLAPQCFGVAALTHKC